MCNINESFLKNENGVTSKRTLILPYPCEKRWSLVRSLPNKMKSNIAFTGTKLSSNFNLKPFKT